MRITKLHPLVDVATKATLSDITQTLGMIQQILNSPSCYELYGKGNTDVCGNAAYAALRQPGANFSRWMENATCCDCYA